MSILGYILVFTFLGSVVSLVGGIILLFKEKFALKISNFLASFAAGTLLGTAFLDLLPEAQSYNSLKNIFFWALLGILFFFLLEKFIHWFHHHHEHPQTMTKQTVALIILGDSVHNFIDGIVIAATFLINIPLGIVTSLAVAAHEIPQEIGDFSILLHRGVPGKKVFWLNLLSALTSLAGALLAYFLGNIIKTLIPIFLSITAGFFIYIALSDLIPEIHLENGAGKKTAIFQSALLFIGVVVVWLFVTLLE